MCTERVPSRDRLTGYSPSKKKSKGYQLKRYLVGRD